LERCFGSLSLRWDFTAATAGSRIKIALLNYCPSPGVVPMFIQIPSAICIEASGPQAARYLQNRLSNEVKSLTPGAGCCNAAALSVQGKIEGLFFVLALSPERYLLLCEGGDPQLILTSLARFKVAERVEFSDVSAQYAVLCWENCSPSDLQLAFPGLSSAPTPGTYLSVDGCFIAPTRGTTGSAVLCLIPQTQAATVTASLRSRTQELLGDALQVALVRANLPAFPAELGSGILLAEAELSHAVSFTKGCYVGQEVVAKIDAIGRAPRRLLPFAADGQQLALKAASITKAEDPSGRTVGEVLSSVFDPTTNETLGFLILRNDPSLFSSKLCAGGIKLRLLSAPHTP